ncbi:hypothetical protein GCM10009868_16430 [Terrabacter aerolatus]|uniref:BLUF domain-containing protein n=1 Tax=Terrabacter aerolatus TaxID=422442 RepID=A0A512D1X0_9MICO|nr:BLUF domain-containing protein [Terrabacter aerolatus]GEO30465.1 hypothetical protein TAE01_22750 [Terrabacter aerolatus]
MLSLTYFSTATTPLDADDLRELLERTRSRNASVGLTGLLLYADGSFVQTLEGPDDVVEETFARISRDTRHRSVSVALHEQVDERHFPDWSMGFRELSDEQTRSVPGFNDYLDGRNAPRTPGGNRAEAFHRAFRTFAP